MDKNIKSNDEEHSRAFREQDAGFRKGTVRLNDNPYATLPAKGISQSASSEGELGYSVGDKVRHIKFGIGTVKDIEKGEKEFEVTVDFPSGTKRMMASFAKLKKAEG